MWKVSDHLFDRKQLQHPCGPSILMNAHLQPPGVEKLGDLEDQKGGAQVRLLLWLGLEQFQSDWAKEAVGGNIAVYAETVRGCGQLQMS